MSLELFKYYLEEREKARLFKEGKSDKNTDDVIIQNEHFCNNDRSHDKVTKQIMAKYVHHVPDNKALGLNLVLARLISRYTTIEQLPIIGSDVALQKDFLLREFEEIKKDTGSFFCGRFVCCFGMEKLLDAVIAFESVYTGTKLHMEDFLDLLAKVPIAKGNFFKWQITCDFVEAGLVYPSDKYVILGPGAKRGLKLAGDLSLKELQEETGLSLMILEHSLCEFARYVRHKNSKKYNKV